ncbi:MAG: CdaR family protein [Desulfuromonadales bacterium]|nr:CdaR family protein [Desulfuromonadales bacterium]
MMLAFINENWKMKAVALGCATLLWFYVMGERRLELAYAVPIELKNVPQGMVVTNDLPKNIDIRLSGPRALLSDLTQKDVRISIDLLGLKPGVTTFSRLDDHLRLPGGIQATRISPSFVDVKLEQLIDKTVPLRPRLVGQLPAGFRLVAMEISPEQVVLQGAEGEIAGVNEVMTERIELAEIKGSSELTVPLEYRGKYSQIKDIKNAKVRLQIKRDVREKIPVTRPAEDKL